MSETNTSSEAATIKKGGKLVPIVSTCCAAAVGAAVTVALLANPSGAKEEPPKRNVVVNEQNVQEVLKDFREPIAVGSYEVNMTFDWIFTDGASASENAYVKNIASNTNDVYFDIIRSDTNETIYASPVLPLGSYLEAITLDTDLDAGEYDCVVVYHLIDEEQNTLSTLKVALTIYVQG